MEPPDTSPDAPAAQAIDAPAGPTLRRLVAAMPKAELHLHLDGSLRIDTALELARTRGIDAPAIVGRHVPGAHRPDAVRRPGRAPARVRPPDRADAGRRGARADHRGARRDEGGRQRSIRRDPVGPAPARRARVVPGRRDRGGLLGGGCGGGPDRGDGPAHLHRPALARSGREPGAGRDRRAVPRPRADRLGPRRSGGRLSGPGRPRPRVRGRPRRWPTDHAPRRRVGRRRAGPARPRDGPRADRAWAGRHRRSPTSARTCGPGT